MPRELGIRQVGRGGGGGLGCARSRAAFPGARHPTAGPQRRAPRPRSPFTDPEIQRTNLAAVILQMLTLGPQIPARLP